MKTLLTFCLMLTCATLHAQTVIVKGTGAGQVHRSGTGAGSVRGAVIWASSNYCDGRFTIWNTNQDVVLDNDSSIMWTRNANVLGHSTNWYVGTNWAAELDHADYQDWRLPSVAEVSRDIEAGSPTGLFDAEPSANDPALPLGHPFTNIQAAVYWTSLQDAIVTNGAWTIRPSNGQLSGDFKSALYYLWLCHGP